MTGLRNVITKKQDSMAIVTIEDLQGSIEVVVFPRLYETTRATWRDGAILLVAGRVDHKGEEVSLLADLVADWDDAVLRGPETFAREVAAGDRSGGRNGHGPRRAPVPVGPGPSATDPTPAQVGAAATRSGAGAGLGTLPPIRPADPVQTYAPSPGSVAVSEGDDDEPAVPDEARARIVADATADAAVAAGPTPSSTCNSRPRRPPTVSSGRWNRCGRCCVIGRARPGSSSMSRVPVAVDRSRWSCDRASPTTPNSSRRCDDDSGTDSWTCASPAPERGRQGAGTTSTTTADHGQ